MTITEPTFTTNRTTADDRSAAAGVLGAAFLDDPVFEWIVPERAALESIIVPSFEYFVDAFARHDETYLTSIGDSPSGVAMWSPPGTAPVHPDDEPALVADLIDLFGDHAERLGACLELFEAAHPADPAWFLQFAGVEPGRQGLGIGSVLLRTVLDRADATGEAAYLEATSPRNRALYERHGFTCIEDITLPDGGPTVYGMWREPRGTDAVR